MFVRIIGLPSRHATSHHGHSLVDFMAVVISSRFHYSNVTIRDTRRQSLSCKGPVYTEHHLQHCDNGDATDQSGVETHCLSNSLGTLSSLNKIIGVISLATSQTHL